jgi:hypothetical protein
MSRTVVAIERHMTPPIRWTTRRQEFGLQPAARRLAGEWQQRGPETPSGYALQKLRLTFTSLQSVITGSAAG